MSFRRMCNIHTASSIQTVLSVLELHQFNAGALADYTAGREFHPALKTVIQLFYKIV